MTYRLLIGAIAGIISAIAFASGATGFSPLHIFLLLFTPLVLYLAGFGLGTAAVGAGVVSGGLAMLLLGVPTLAIAFCLAHGLPALLLTHLASLNRTLPGGAIEWYPVGRIVIAAALIAGLLAGLTIAALESDRDAVQSALKNRVETVLQQQIAELPGTPPITPSDVDDIVSSAIEAIPRAAVTVSMIGLLLNMWLAARITLASGRLQRPWPHLPSMTYPPGTVALLAVPLALTFAPGTIGHIAQGLAGTLYFAYVLLGLAVLHFVTRGRSWRAFALGAVYVSLIPLYDLAPLALALLGLAETIWPIRRMVLPHDQTPSP